MDAGSLNMTVNMGQVRTNQFSYVGLDIKSIPLKNHLKDCNEYISRNINVRFQGLANEKKSNLLSINDGFNSAKDISIALFNSNNQLILINFDNHTYSSLKNGDLDFIAKYRAVGKNVT
ncbi:fimbrial protein [Providencia rettgeri]